VNALVLCNLQCEHLGKHGMQIVIESLLAGRIPGSSIETSTKHYTRVNDKRERGKPSDCWKIRYCVGCYSRFAETDGRDVTTKSREFVT
jgi:hypothetical protein